MLEELENLLPFSWSLTCLTFLDPEWQVIIKDDEHVALATGETIEDALTNAASKALNHIYVGRLFSLGRAYHEPTEPASAKSLLQSLGLAKPEQPLTRRI